MFKSMASEIGRDNFDSLLCDVKGGCEGEKGKKERG
jgi:hypothetical protein